MNDTVKLFEQFKNTIYVISVFPNVLVTTILLAFVIYSIYKLKIKTVVRSKYLGIYSVCLLLFPIIISYCGIEASKIHLPFDSNRSMFIRETFFIHLSFLLNISFVLYMIIKSKEVRLFFISSGLLSLWVSFVCWGFSLLISCNNVFI